MNTNEHEREQLLFVWIRVHSWFPLFPSVFMRLHEEVLSDPVRGGQTGGFTALAQHEA